MIQPKLIYDFVEELQRKVDDYRERESYENSVHDQHHKVKYVPGKKYGKINIGGSGRFMFEYVTGDLYFIKGYGTIDKKKFFGNIQDLVRLPDNWWFEGYSICDVGRHTRYGYAGRISTEMAEKISSDPNNGEF